MELKKIFPKWWHPVIPTAIIMLVELTSEDLADIPLVISYIFMMYFVIYIMFVFWRTGYLVVKDVYHAIAK